MSLHAKETDLQYWSDFANRDGVCFHKDDAHMLVREHHELESLKVENAQLRELVRDLVRWYGVEHLPHEELWFWGDKSGGVYARMRELGIEVDE